MSSSTTSHFSSPNSFGFASALWRQRELLWQFTLRNVEMRHRGSHLGLIWSILNPLLMMALYVFVFGYIFGGTFSVLPNETKMDYALAIFLGLTIFQIFAEVFATTPTTIVSTPNFVKKVVFPLEILPAAVVGSSLFHVLVALVMVLIGVAVVGPGLSLRVLWLPVILFPVTLLALGMGWFFAAVGVFLRDLNQLVAFLSMVLMYASALFYPIRLIPDIAWSVLQFNPILVAVDLARGAVLWDREVDGLQLLYLFVVSIITCLLGYWSFKKLAPAFADVL